MMRLTQALAIQAVTTKASSWSEYSLSDSKVNLGSPQGQGLLVERNIGRSGNGLFASLHPPPREPRGWTSRGFTPRALLIFTFLCHQSLGGDVLVGSLQHLRYSCGGLLHKRPKKAGRLNPDHESLDDQQWMRIGNGPDFVCEAGEVLSEVFRLLLSYPEEGCDSWLWSGAGEKITLKLHCELIKRVNGGGRYHPRAIPRRVVGKARHIMASEVPYRVICA
ncbi:hypothetical protein B296_00035069 [Ensete ventricosum]|uniref:Uncharacterized protein n=1 Tax=Ensete ventricosum TaxID=4639 RepID=A0A426XC08_ENSVE|nr:hypothetical protein B296_00035069 [Ensete ventricosum]